jgi:hypothetical protein
MGDSSKLKMQHTSLQFSDERWQQEKDINDLFAEGTQFPIKTGTEAGPDAAAHNANRVILKEVAADFKHNLHFAADNWIAVDRGIVKDETFRRDQIFVADNDETWGHGHDSVFATVSFEHIDPRLGRIAVAAAHYPVRGQEPGDPNFHINRRYADKAFAWMKRSGMGSSLAFLNGDFNMQDKISDWAFGNGFTSMADELRMHQNTGHGAIDGFCSYNRDHRVKADWFNVLDDSEFFQFSDHFVCRGAWIIQHRNH